jgi:hypothetical protein
MRFAAFEPAPYERAALRWLQRFIDERFAAARRGAPSLHQRLPAPPDYFG